MGDLANLVNAVEETQEVHRRQANRPTAVTPPQVGKMSASRRAQLLSGSNVSTAN